MKSSHTQEGGIGVASVKLWRFLKTTWPSPLHVREQFDATNGMHRQRDGTCRPFLTSPIYPTTSNHNYCCLYDIWSCAFSEPCSCVIVLLYVSRYRYGRNRNMGQVLSLHGDNLIASLYLRRGCKCKQVCRGNIILLCL